MTTLSAPNQLLEDASSRYLRDMRVNLSSIFELENINKKEAALLGVAIATNGRNERTLAYFTEAAREHGATTEEIGDAVACASLLSANNVLYRFRHFTEKDTYEQLPARIKMNIMMNPVLGKEFFELVSLAVSAVNGCERCVKAHEASLLQLGTREERIFESIRVAAIVESVNKVF